MFHHKISLGLRSCGEGVVSLLASLARGKFSGIRVAHLRYSIADEWSSVSIRDNALDHVHSNAIEVSDLTERHSIESQRSNPTVLGSRYLGRSCAHRSSASRFRIGRWHDGPVRHRDR
jgi:hypothetical protein